jgi:hypothetical protein
LLYQLSYRPDQPRIIAELRRQITGNAIRDTERDREKSTSMKCNKSHPEVLSLEWHRKRPLRRKHEQRATRWDRISALLERSERFSLGLERPH